MLGLIKSHGKGDRIEKYRRLIQYTGETASPVHSEIFMSLCLQRYGCRVQGGHLSLMTCSRRRSGSFLHLSFLIFFQLEIFNVQRWHILGSLSWTLSPVRRVGREWCGISWVIHLANIYNHPQCSKSGSILCVKKYKEEEDSVLTLKSLKDWCRNHTSD